MSEEEKGARPVTPPVLAQVLAHPSGQLMVMLNDGIPAHDQAGFCLGCAQTFIGLAANLMGKEQQETIVKPEDRIIVPTLHMRGGL